MPDQPFTKKFFLIHLWFTIAAGSLIVIPMEVTSFLVIQINSILLHLQLCTLVVAVMVDLEPIQLSVTSLVVL